ncbi:MAG: Uma2 family endonuclease [Roseiflexaceae bacterium]
MSSDLLEAKQIETKNPPPSPVSFEEFLAWCDEDTHAEWVDGAIIMMSPASDQHQDLVEFLITILRLFNESQQAGWVRSGPFLMRTDVKPSGREPDILFVTKERMQLVQPTFLDGPADLIIEIVSPESIGRDRGEKFVEYEAAGVKEYWLIDPLRQQAEFYQLDDQGVYRAAALDADGRYYSIMLPSFWLRVTWLWQKPLPPLLSVLKELGVI